MEKYVNTPKTNYHYGIFGADIDYNLMFYQQEEEVISAWLLITGIVGQLVYTFRLIYQWIYSENKKKKSSLPLGFWWLSLVGSAIVLVYAIYREDPVLLASHLGGSIIYVCNVYIGLKTHN